MYIMNNFLNKYFRQKKKLPAFQGDILKNFRPGDRNVRKV